MDPDLEIELADAENSIEIERGFAALSKTSAQQKQRLLDIARTEHERADHFQQLYEQEKAKNERLEAELAQLRARPLYYIDQFAMGDNVNSKIQAI